jgi:sugar phosphate isomerase/epimerase
MRLGFVTAILPDLDFEQVLEFAKAEGFDCVEAMCWPRGKAERRYAGVTHIDVSDFTPYSAAKVNALLERYGISLSALGYYANPLSADAEESAVTIAHLEKLIHAAALLGVRAVNTFVGRDQNRSVDANWPRFLEVWRPLLALAEKQGVRIGIENCPMLFTEDEWPGGKNLATTPAIWRRMFADLPSAFLGLNFDPSHLLWQRIDHIKPLREFAPRLFHVHAKDCSIDVERCDEVGILASPLSHHTPRLPGLGGVRWMELFATLHAVGYTGAVCAEVEDRAFEGSLELRKEALRRCAAFLRPLIAAHCVPQTS